MNTRALNLAKGRHGKLSQVEVTVHPLATGDTSQVLPIKQYDLGTYTLLHIPISE